MDVPEAEAGYNVLCIDCAGVGIFLGLGSA